jgi:predicted PurR-regulated permease PerM
VSVEPSAETGAGAQAAAASWHRRERRYRAGPLAWTAIIAATCAILYLMQHVLWLVVPALGALVIYYLLAPLQQRLVLAGVSRESSAILVTVGATLLLVGAIMLVLPETAGFAAKGEVSMSRYVEGGLRFTFDALASLERSFSFLARAHIVEAARDWITTHSAAAAEKYLGSALVTLAGWLPSILLAPFLAFFFLRDGRRFKHFLVRSVPNAYFERTLYLVHQVDQTARLYFQGLIKLTALDALALGIGLWLIGMPSPVALGLITAVLAWVPYVGSIMGCVLVVLVAATDFAGDPLMAYSAVCLFIFVRLLDDFVFMPMTIGKSLELHPLLTVVMIFAGGAVAGVPGLMLVLPLVGVIAVLGETLGAIITSPRLRARHAHARRLQLESVTRDLA